MMFCPDCRMPKEEVAQNCVRGASQKLVSEEVARERLSALLQEGGTDAAEEGDSRDQKPAIEILWLLTSWESPLFAFGLLVLLAVGAFQLTRYLNDWVPAQLDSLYKATHGAGEQNSENNRENWHITQSSGPPEQESGARKPP